MAATRKVLVLGLVVPLAGCAERGQQDACPLPGQQRMLAVDMFFGRDIAGRAPVSDAEWTGFAGTEVTPRFPEGFTVVQGSGQWLNPATHSIGREASIVVRAVVVPAPDLAARVRAVSDAYRARFQQVAVGVVTAPVCAKF